MTIFPVLIDTRPSFLDETSAHSLLLLPLGNGTLLEHVVSSVARTTPSRPMLLPSFAAEPRYLAAVQSIGAGVEIIADSAALRTRVTELEPSDSLLLIDPIRYPVSGLDLQPLVSVVGEDLALVRHLLAFEVTSGRTAEYVHADSSGQVRRIQRYYHPVTWPFATAVVASLVPVAALLARERMSLPLTSLPDLRRALAGAGVPSRDVPTNTNAYDLSDESGVLAMSERYMLEVVRPRETRRALPDEAWQHSGHLVGIHPTARLLGPVAGLDDAIVEANAVIVGPTVLGARARIGAGATVAQCLVLPGAHVHRGTTVRHRVVATQTGDTPTQPRRAHSGRYTARPAAEPEGTPRRVGFETTKRLIDIVVAVTAVVLLLPVIVVLVVIIKLGSRGPLLYGGVREGKGGKLFHCWKFRSMYVGADAKQRELAAQSHVDGPQFKIADDPRVTRIGKHLRRTNLDELPQLLNVIRGEMSFVGPRPSPFRENQVCVPWRQGRLSVRPGITGLWQICRHDRSQGDFHQWVQYDLLYVRHASIWIDCKIFVATILTAGGRWPVSVERIIPVDAVEPLPSSSSTRVEAEEAARAEPRLRWGLWLARATMVTVLLLVLSEALRAQGAPIPQPPPLRGGTAGAPPGWTFSFWAQQLWENNVQFARPDGPDDYLTRGGVLVGREVSDRRGRLSILAGGDVTTFRSEPGLNRATYRASVDASRRLTRRLSAGLGAATLTSLARDVIGTTAAAALLPLALTHVTDGSAVADYLLSPMTTAHVDSRFDRVTFDTPLLVDGWSAGGRLGVTHRSTPSRSLGLSYEFSRASSQGFLGDVQTVLANWEQRFGRHTSLRLSSGAVRVQRLGRTSDGTHTEPGGGAELRVEQTRGAFAASYARSATQAFGFGRLVVSDRLSATYQHELTPGVGLSARANHSRSVDPAAGDFHVTFDEYGGELQWTVAHDVGLGFGPYVRSQRQQVLIVSQGVALSVAYGGRIR